MMDAIAWMVGAATTGPKGWCEAGEMIPVLTRHEVQVALDAGLEHEDVAERPGQRSLSGIPQRIESSSVPSESQVAGEVKSAVSSA